MFKVNTDYESSLKVNLNGWKTQIALKRCNKIIWSHDVYFGAGRGEVKPV